MANHPPVSIIIPCWNAEQYVSEAIESALGQTYPNAEVIVIDDGSTDNSLDIIRSFASRVRWATGPNRGGSAARNRGLALAQGEFIQFLDADDLLYPDKLAKQVPLSLARGPGVACICDWEVLVAANAHSRKRQSLNYCGEDPVLYCLRSQLPTPSPLHWKDSLQAIGGFDESLPCSQERDLHLRLACSGVKFVYRPEVLYQVRRRQNSVSADYGTILRQHGNIFFRAFQALQKQGDLSDARARAFAETLARDARRCLSGGDIDTAKHYFELAEFMHRDGALQAFGWWTLRATARLFGMASAERLCQLALRLGIRP